MAAKFCLVLALTLVCVALAWADFEDERQVNDIGMMNNGMMNNGMMNGMGRCARQGNMCSLIRKCCLGLRCQNSILGGRRCRRIGSIG